MTRTLGCSLTVVALVALLFPTGASAQQAGAIAGVVRDTTGAVLPGVTVEATSPALIEKVRTTTTDAAGQYRIVDLRPGVYSVTFALEGFLTLKREGVELSAGFTANESVELRVGSLEETITVSGASPLVDVQTVSQQRVMTREVIDSIPTSKQYTALAALIPGVVTSAPGGAINQDVGGMTGMTMTNAQIHGGDEGDGAPRVNGMSIASITSPGNSRSNLQDANVEEHAMQLSASPAEFPYGGIYFNVIPKQGSNQWAGTLFIGGTTEALHASNLDADLIRGGLEFPNQVRKILDFNPAYGGPIARNRLWMYAAGRYFLTDSYVPGLYLNKDVQAWTYEPDTAQRAVNDQDGKNGSLNLTFQATPKNKFTVFYNYDFQCYCHYEIGSGSGSVTSIISSEASRLMKSRAQLIQGTWNSPLTGNLLLEAGASRYYQELPRDNQPESVEPSIFEQSTGFNFRAHPVGYARNDGIIDHYRASLTYVSGAHSLKFGFEHERQWADDTDRQNGSMKYRTLNGIPNQATYYTLPYAWQSYNNPLGIYAQDQWTIRRWTINAGLRYDQFKSSYPASHVDPTPFLPVERDYPGGDVFDWKDLNPRLGVSWDVFGHGRTAVKATLSRYIKQEGKTYTNAAHPVLTARGESR